MTDEPVMIPEWVVFLVGRLTLENEGLRNAARAEPEQPAHSAAQQDH